MKVIAGLGNKGKKYQDSRHNVGFMAIDYFSSLHSINFETDKYSHSLVAKIGNEDILVKPQTFMNSSGETIKKLSKIYDRPNLLVIHDDIDIPFGSVRFRRGGSSGGHKGIESVINMVGKDFYRIRVGINNQNSIKIETEKFVLKNFNRTEKQNLPKIFEICKGGIEDFLANNFAETTYFIKAK